MKRISTIITLALLALVSCQKEIPAGKPEGVRLTLNAAIAEPDNATKTSYVYSSGSQAGTIAVSWEATEYITVVSIGESGITAVDEFVSTGDAGRTKAEFTGTWNGNAGDKVICLYPAITTTAGAARYSGVTAGSTSIGVNFPAHAPSQDISTIKDYDLMFGDVAISGTAASVTMQRKISVLRLGISGAAPYESGYYGKYILKLGIAACSSTGTPKLFASHAVIAATKATYTGTFVADEFYAGTRYDIVQQSKEGTFYYYVPLIANGSLVSGDKFSVYYRVKEYTGTIPWDTIDDSKSITLTSTLTFAPGYVYEIDAGL